MSRQILILTHTDQGGAGTAILGFANGLRDAGYGVEMIVGKKGTDSELVSEVPAFSPGLGVRILRRLKRSLAPKPMVTVEKYFFFNIDERIAAFSEEQIAGLVVKKPDIVVGAWLSFFLNYETIGRVAKRFGAQPYLLMNDMAMLTGGCHYAWDCTGYTRDCSDCPAIVQPEYKQRAMNNLQLRHKAISEYGIHIIAGSQGTLEQCRMSTLFKDQQHIRVYNGLLDFTVFHAGGREEARLEMGFSVSERVILCGTNNFDDPRKGKAKFTEALREMDRVLSVTDEPPRITLMLVGDLGDTAYHFKHVAVRKVPVVKEKGRLALIYKAADLYVSPSVEDSGPLMVVEALACGTPVIGFDIGFVHDFVQDGLNGYRVSKYDAMDMGRKMALMVQTKTDRAAACTNSVKNVFSKDQLIGFFNG